MEDTQQGTSNMEFKATPQTPTYQELLSHILNEDFRYHWESIMDSLGSISQRSTDKRLLRLVDAEYKRILFSLEKSRLKLIIDVKKHVDKLHEQLDKDKSEMSELKETIKRLKIENTQLRQQINVDHANNCVYSLAHDLENDVKRLKMQSESCMHDSPSSEYQSQVTQVIEKN